MADAVGRHPGPQRLPGGRFSSRPQSVSSRRTCSPPGEQPPAARPASANTRPVNPSRPLETTGRTRGAAARSPVPGLRFFGSQFVVELCRDCGATRHVPLGPRILDIVELPLHIVHECRPPAVQRDRGGEVVPLGITGGRRRARRGVAQFGSAPEWGSGGAGSNPVAPTTFHGVTRGNSETEHGWQRCQPLLCTAARTGPESSHSLWPAGQWTISKPQCDPRGWTYDYSTVGGARSCSLHSTHRRNCRRLSRDAFRSRETGAS